MAMFESGQVGIAYDHFKVHPNANDPRGLFIETCPNVADSSLRTVPEVPDSISDLFQSLSQRFVPDTHGTRLFGGIRIVLLLPKRNFGQPVHME